MVLSVALSAAINHLPDDHRSVKIGNQVWMLENLTVDHFRNGDPIPHAVTGDEWVQAGKEGKPAWCYYENREDNGVKYGRLYNWYAVTDTRGLAPKGWHVATDAEWRMVTDHLGGEDAAGTKMKSNSGWPGEEGNGTNESGFSGLPGGSRNLFGEFAYGEQAGYWWTSTAQDHELAWYRVIDRSPWYVYRTNYSKANGLSVRCVKE
jgi:uncharacterized protein (TIGR02145 family)